MFPCNLCYLTTSSLKTWMVGVKYILLKLCRKILNLILVSGSSIMSVLGVDKNTKCFCFNQLSSVSFKMNIPIYESMYVNLV